jgi:microcystin-dependent protein
MGEPYVGEIRMFAGNFAPAGWMFCDGQLIPISENETLFNLIGTTYGGDGQETFALPNLQSRIPIHAGTGPAGTTYQLAETAGVETVTLTTQQIPVHSHVLTASGATATGRDPLQQNMLAPSAGDTYVQSLDPVPMSAQAITPAGGSQPHENCQPFLCINFIISMFGVFPSQT